MKVEALSKMAEEVRFLFCFYSLVLAAHKPKGNLLLWDTGRNLFEQPVTAVPGNMNTFSNHLNYESEPYVGSF